MNIKEKIEQNKYKILAGAAIIGAIGIVIVTKGKSKKALHPLGKTMPFKSLDLPIPEGLAGVWDCLWLESKPDGDAITGIVNEINLSDCGKLGENLATLGFSETVGIIVGGKKTA